MKENIRLGLLLGTLLILLFLPIQAEGTSNQLHTVTSICDSFDLLCVHIHFTTDCDRAFIGGVVEDVSISIQGWSGPYMYAWTKPYQQESFLYDFTLQIVFPAEPTKIYTQQFQGALLEPSDCLRSCELKHRYYMYTFHDANQPDTWQQYCYIISNNGYPSVESQARICSVPGYDHVYRATNMAYSGWVDTDCYGNTIYGWPDWQSLWYRPQFVK